MENIVFEQIKEYTPCYLLDVYELHRRVRWLKERLPKRVKLCFAMKANSFLISELENLVERFEVCSFGEFQICKGQRIDAKKLVISGVKKEKDEVLAMMDYQSGIFTVESMSQFALLKDCNREIKILLRLTSGNQFGMKEEEIEEILSHQHEYPYLHIVGLEYFSGTQKRKRQIEKELEYLDNYIKKIKETYDIELEELEYGGGFPICYYEGQEDEEEEFLQCFSDSVVKMEFQGNFILELGRSIVASCGTYITQIKDIKDNQNGNFAIVDGGMHQMVYYGSVLSMRKPMMEVRPYRDEEKKDYNVCGSLCTINDFLVKHLEADLRVGDYLLFKNTGAYSLTEGISLFLSRDLPSIFLYKDNRVIRIRDKVETYVFNTYRKEGE